MTLITVWLRTTPPFSWAWPYLERFGEATRLTDFLLWSERAIHRAVGAAKTGLAVLRGMVRL